MRQSMTSACLRPDRMDLSGFDTESSHPQPTKASEETGAVIDRVLISTELISLSDAGEADAKTALASLVRCTGKAELRGPETRRQGLRQIACQAVLRSSAPSKMAPERQPLGPGIRLDPGAAS